MEMEGGERGTVQEGLGNEYFHGAASKLRDRSARWRRAQCQLFLPLFQPRYLSAETCNDSDRKIRRDLSGPDLFSPPLPVSFWFIRFFCFFLRYASTYLSFFHFCSFAYTVSLFVLRRIRLIVYPLINLLRNRLFLTRHAFVHIIYFVSTLVFILFIVHFL